MALPWPITPFSATATMSTISISAHPATAPHRSSLRSLQLRAAISRTRRAREPATEQVPLHRDARGGSSGTYNRSHRDLGLDVRMRVVVLKREVVITEGEDILHGGIDGH